MVDWKKELDLIPLDWALTPVKEKRPLRPSWQSEQPLERDILLELLANGQSLASSNGTWHCRWTGIGLRLGAISNNLMAVDLDGTSAGVKFGEISANCIPDTISWTSGREGRSQMLFRIPHDVAKQVTTVKIPCAPDEYLEFRWDGCQSVLPPSLHPKTGSYKWLNSPSTHPVADAPDWLLSFLFQQAPPPPKPAERIRQSYINFVSEDTWDDRDWALSYLEALSPSRADNHDEWVKIGMALHSVGDDSLLDLWDRWSSYSPKYKPGVCQKRWKSFKRSSSLKS